MVRACDRPALAFRPCQCCTRLRRSSAWELADRGSSYRLVPVGPLSELRATQEQTELVMCGLQARVGGLDGAAQDVGGLGDGKALDLVEQEQVALVVGERGESGERSRRASGRPSSQGAGNSVKASRVLEPRDVSALTIVRRDSHGDRVEPAPQRGASLELVEPAVHDEEHVLANIVEVGVHDAQRPQRARRSARGA